MNCQCRLLPAAAATNLTGANLTQEHVEAGTVFLFSRLSESTCSNSRVVGFLKLLAAANFETMPSSQSLWPLCSVWLSTAHSLTQSLFVSVSFTITADVAIAAAAASLLDLRPAHLLPF